MSDASLILATRNAKKLAELRRILEASGVDVSVTDLSEYPDMPEVAETGATFTENALLKARAVVAHTGRPAVAEDSGLCIDALNGMPGVLSARWAGRHGDDEANLRLVLGQLADVPADRRGGAFHLRGGAGAAVRQGARHRGDGQRPRSPTRRAARTGSATTRSSCPPALRADHGGDEPGGQGRDQPPGPRAARPGADRRRAARRLRPAAGTVVAGDAWPFPRREQG